MRLLFVAFMSATACGLPAERGGSGSLNAEVETNEVGTSRSPIVLGPSHEAPAQAVELGRGALDLVGQAVETATVLAGVSVARTFGTLREREGRVTYEAEPSDRLLIERSNGDRASFVILELSGSGADAASFFQGDHDVRVEIDSQLLHGEVWSSRRGTARSAGVSGQMMLDGAEWRGRLMLEGTETFESDRSGSRYFDDHELSGELGTDGTNVIVDEHWTFELVTARDGISTNRAGSASSGVRRVDNVVEVGGHHYEWSGVQTRKAFRDGKPTELDTYWSGAGEIRRDGAPYGRVEKFVNAYDESGGFVGFNAVTADGPIELERYQAY